MKPDDFVSWIDLENEEQAEWVTGRFNAYLPTNWHRDFELPNLKEALLTWAQQDARRLLELQKWKKTWNQKRRRARAGSRQQINVLLERSQARNLDRLAKHRGVSKSEVISELIGDATRQAKDEKAQHPTNYTYHEVHLRQLSAENQKLKNESNRKFQESNDVRKGFLKIINDLYQELDEFLPDACRWRLLRSPRSFDGYVPDSAVRELAMKEAEAIRRRLAYIRLMRLGEYEGPFASENQSLL